MLNGRRRKYDGECGSNGQGVDEEEAGEHGRETDGAEVEGKGGYDEGTACRSKMRKVGGDD